MSCSNTQLKVMHIASGDLWAGAEVQLFTLAKFQNKLSSVSLLVVLMNDGLLAQRLRQINIDVWVFDEAQLNGLSTLLKLTRLMRKWKPDIVHTHRQKENIIGSVANALSVRAKSLRTAHGAPEFSISFVGQPLRWLVLWLDNLCARFLQKTVIAVSGELAAILRYKFGEKKVAIALNGIDVTELQENAEVLVDEFDSNCKHIGIVGRLEPVKRVDLFLQIAKLSHSEGNANWRFHVFGDGSLFDSLQSDAESMGLSVPVKFHGHRNDIAQCMHSIDVLIVCSDHEGLPMTALESVALGTPIVAHAVGGLTKLLSDSAGLLVQRQSVEDYYRVILSVFEGKCSLSPIFPEQYRAENNANRIIELYRN